MSGGRRVTAFSLVEVVIAVGLFAFAIVSILALLPLTARQAAASRDLQTAARLGDAIRLEVQQLVPPDGFARFASLQLRAARDGTGVLPLDPRGTANDNYFLIEVTPYDRPPLQYSAGIPLFVLSAKITWPRRGGAVVDPTPASPGGQCRFVFALRP